MHTLFSTETLNASPWPKRWLWLGISALAIAGIFSVILVAARTPQLAMFKELFSVSLVVHVDLSVLVWFLAMAGLGWAYHANLGMALRIPYLQGAAFGTAAVATALMALSPLHPHWEVIKSNYVPVLNNVVFLLGLSLLFASMLLAIMPVLLRFPTYSNDARGLVHRTIYWGAWIVAVAMMCFALSARGLPQGLDTEQRFETLFWAGGHALQFLYVQLAMLGWFVMLSALGATPSEKSCAMLAWVLPIGAAASFASLPAFWMYAVGSPEFMQFFTHKMISLGGVAPAFAGIFIFIALIKMGKPPREQRAYYSSLVMSLLLFAAGGIAFLIQGQNVTIPAHYHGSIVGVTLALMGMVYVLLPQLGYRNVAATRAAFWQPILYGGGQLLHVGGLAWSGGYGVLRKYTGELPVEVKAAMGLMGLGGLLAILGGLLFVVVVVRAARTKI